MMTTATNHAPTIHPTLCCPYLSQAFAQFTLGSVALPGGRRKKPWQRTLFPIIDKHGIIEQNGSTLPAGVWLRGGVCCSRACSIAKEFVIVDAAMNDLIRPALYHARHEIIPLRKNSLPPVTVDVVGPVCETGDFLARDREMANVMPGDFLAVCTAGAYGFVQSSNYNSRPRAVEVLVEGSGYRVIRKRETYQDLVRGETV
jgi:hypothetical protein